jgi:hypothetical protein
MAVAYLVLTASCLPYLMTYMILCYLSLVIFRNACISVIDDGGYIVVMNIHNLVLVIRKREK